MAYELGIDLGSSAVKLAAVRPGNGPLPCLAVRKEGPCDHPDAFIRGLLAENGIVPEDVISLAVTGIGAPRIPDRLLGLPVFRADEFAATAAGALALSGEGSGVVVSMGTGTAFVYARGREIRHLCGSGIGGGTLTGLGLHLAGTRDFGELCALSGTGSVKNVDLTVGDLLAELPPTLHPDMTVTNFGRTEVGASPADLAAGAVNLVLQAIGTMTLLACRGCGCGTAILTGSVTALPQAAECFSLFERLYGVRFCIPSCAAYATAAGAAVLARERIKKADG